MVKLALMTGIRVVLVAAVAAFSAAATARAGDGGAAAPSPTYYEAVMESVRADGPESTTPGLPTTLHVVDTAAAAQYSEVQAKPEGIEWRLQIDGLYRRHERVDAVYQMVAILPLPADLQGQPAFEALQWGLIPCEGSAEASVPFIYGGEKVVLKRNVTLERTLLPNLVDPSGGDGKLPSLAGTGYAYTLWDAIIRYDPGYGNTLQVFTDFRYATDTSVAAPDAADERFKVYLVTWIPALDPTIPPFTLRIDVRESE